MDGFKETEIGLIPEDWGLFGFQKTLIRNRANRSNQINASEIKKAGEFPVIDQGQEFIAGFYDDENKLLNLEAPVIIFGDHTRCFKYVDFPFIIGADGTKVLSPNLELFDPKFYYFYLLSLDIPSRGYNRHFRFLKEKIIIRPDFQEQHKIAHILSRIQDAIEKQEQIIKTTTELKKALMQKLFTEGLHGEPPKETEIGLIPESWEVKKLQELYTYTSKPRNLNIKDKEEIPFIPMELVPDDKYLINSFRMRETKSLSSGTYIENCDLLLAKITPSFENGKQGIVNFPYDYGYATTEVIPIKDVKGVSNKYYLFYYLLKDDIRSLLAGKMEGSTGRQRLGKNILSSILIPAPPLEEQTEIANIFMTLDNKIECRKRKKKTLESLFRSLLNRLMTGQIRVKDLEFDMEELEKRRH